MIRRIPLLRLQQQREHHDFFMHLNILQQQIHQIAQQSGRSPAEVNLLAVSKGQTIAKIKEAYALGLRDFGESYWQEAREKQQALADLDITWHYLGALQSNKIKMIAQHFDWVHTATNTQELQKLSTYRTGKPLQVCIQVQVEGGLGRRGAEPCDLPALFSGSYPHLHVCGFMVMLKPDLNEDEQFFAFSKVRELAKTFGLETLSMGMSSDFPAAIRAGSHWVRIGRTLFGER